MSQMSSEPRNIGAFSIEGPDLIGLPHHVGHMHGAPPSDWIGSSRAGKVSPRKSIKLLALASQLQIAFGELTVLSNAPFC